VLYQSEEQPAYEEEMPALQAGPLVQQGLCEWSRSDHEALLGVRERASARLFPHS